MIFRNKKLYGNWLKYLRYIDSVCSFMFMKKCVIKFSDEPVDARLEI